MRALLTGLTFVNRNDSILTGLTIWKVIYLIEWALAHTQNYFN